MKGISSMKPNIIFLIQDQMQQAVIHPKSGCLMPNLNRLLEDSAEFVHTHTSNAICSPARASFLTGTLPHIHGMVDCTHTVPPYRAEYDETLDTVTRALHDEGYHVSYYGKWHIERTHALEKYGIDEYETELHIPGFQVSMLKRVMIKTPGYSDKTVCGVFKEGPEQTEEFYVYQRAIENIEKHKNDGRPFCTFISTYAPHDPYVVPEEIYRMYDSCEPDLPESYYDSMQDKPGIYRRMRSALDSLSESDFRMARRCYFSYCTLVDLQMGRLFKYLKDNDLYDNTIIVCLSDHGDMMGAHRMMMKSVESFEEIYHIPFVLKLPGQQYAGKKVDAEISICEIGPTVLDLAGCRSLNSPYAAKSVLPWLQGTRKEGRVTMAEFFGQRFAYTQRIVWMDNLKYVFNAFDEDEFYDLSKDPHEFHNLNHHPDYKEQQKALCTKMWDIIKETDDTTMADAEYFLMRFAPVGPGKKKSSGSYSIYNKSF